MVRLKGGDPFIFGRGGEEAEVLRRAGIAYEIVPGVTSALGAAAYAGIPLTHRCHASAVALITGHENPAKPDAALDWSALARFPGTLAIYMGMSRLPQIVRTLVQHGMDARTPAAAIHQATTGEQQTLEAPLGELPAAVQGAGLTAPAIVIIGPVVGLRAEVQWFEQRPLFGKRVLVTRPRRRPPTWFISWNCSARSPFVFPVVEIKEPADWADRWTALSASSRLINGWSSPAATGCMDCFAGSGRSAGTCGH